MEKNVMTEDVWLDKLRELLASASSAGVSIRYEVRGAILVASRCQLEVDGRVIVTHQKPTKLLGLGDNALAIELPEEGHPLAGYYYFEDEKGDKYLSVKIPICGFLSHCMAEFEIATNPALLDPSVHAPLVH